MELNVGWKMVVLKELNIELQIAQRNSYLYYKMKT